MCRERLQTTLEKRNYLFNQVTDTILSILEGPDQKKPSEKDIAKNKAKLNGVMGRERVFNRRKLAALRHSLSSLWHQALEKAQILISILPGPTS